MKKLISFIFITLSMLSCTTYEFIPPETMEGRECVNRCLQVRQACYLTCQHADAECQKRADNDRYKQYLAYVANQQMNYQQVTRGPRDFTSSVICSKWSCDGRCDGSYRQCFVNCGGTILEVQN